MRKYLGLLFVLGSGVAFAYPSSLISIPDTDIQPVNTWHLGSISYQAADGSSAISDQGLTYGASPRVEVGFDLYTPDTSPAAVNAKVLLTKPGVAKVPVAVGIYNVGTPGTAFDQRIAYIVGSKAYSNGTRFTLGAYEGKKSALGDTNDGALAGVEYTKAKWWYSVDYLSGENAVGSVNGGVAYSFAPNTSVIFGYDDYTKKGIENTYNVQVGINF